MLVLLQDVRNVPQIFVVPGRQEEVQGAQEGREAGYCLQTGKHRSSTSTTKRRGGGVTTSVTDKLTSGWTVFGFVFNLLFDSLKCFGR